MCVCVWGGMSAGLMQQDGCATNEAGRGISSCDEAVFGT